MKYVKFGFSNSWYSVIHIDHYGVSYLEYGECKKTNTCDICGIKDDIEEIIEEIRTTLDGISEYGIRSK